MAGIVTSEDAGPLIARASIAVYIVAACFVVLRSVLCVLYRELCMLMDDQIRDPRMAGKEMGLRRLVHRGRARKSALQHWSSASVLTRQQLFGAGETVTLLLQVKHGRGRHSDEVALEDLNKMTMVNKSRYNNCTAADYCLVQIH